MSARRASDSRDVMATVGIVLALLVAFGARPIWRRFLRHPSAERCAAMLDRHAELRARSYERIPPAPAPRPLDAPEVARCTHELTADEVECALGAGYVDALERCLPP